MSVKSRKKKTASKPGKRKSATKGRRKVSAAKSGPDTSTRTEIAANGKRTMSTYRRQVRGGGIMPSVPGLNFRDTQFRADGGLKNSARFVVNIAVDGRVKVWSWSVPEHGPVKSLREACKHLAKLRKEQYDKFPDSAQKMMNRAISDFVDSSRRGYTAKTMSKEFRETRKALAALK